MFKFLLALQQAQMALQQWQQNRMQFRNRGGELRAIWELRTHMEFRLTTSNTICRWDGVSERKLFSVKGFITLTVREIIQMHLLQMLETLVTTKELLQFQVRSSLSSQTILSLFWS